MPIQEKILVLLEAIIAFINEGVIVADMDGTVLYHNPAAGELLGTPGNVPICSLDELGELIQGDELLTPSSVAQVVIAKGVAGVGGEDAEGPDFARFEKRIQCGDQTRFLEFHCCRTCEAMGPMRLLIVRDRTEARRLNSLLDRPQGELVSSDPKMLAILDRVARVAPSDAAVLLQGESGTGKTHIARLAHRMSRRSEQPFIEVNCAAIPEGLIESELFGHVKGAFTGASRDRVGRFQAAQKGTLFLDEIAEIPLHLQAKLLRAIQDHKFEPVGSDRTVEADVRIVSASNKDLGEMVDAGRFRADLYYRLSVFPLNIPPLRERRSDIPPLLKYFCGKLEVRGYPADIRCSADALRLLMAYDWPGNVREFENAIEYAFICAVDKRIEPESLPLSVRFHKAGHIGNDRNDGPPNGARGDNDSENGVGDQTQRFEIDRALARAQGNKTLAAKYLGVDRSTLWRRMRRLNISADRH